MSKPWGKIGAWAADSERAEAEELAAAAASATAPPASTFPSLREAASAPKQKKKTNKMSLHEFTTSSSSSHHSLTPSEMLRLPTGPKQRSPEEMLHGTGSRLGGGFSSYGGNTRPRDEGRRSYGGGFESDGPPSSEFSRADDSDHWGSGKKTNSFDTSGRTNKYTSLGSGRADDVDNWGAGKRAPVARSGFGSGFRDPGVERVSGFERPRLVLDPPKKEPVGPVDGPAVGPARSNKPSPFGAARPREEVLAEKGLDWKKMEIEIEEKKKIITSRPNSAQSSRPNSAQSNRSESVEVKTIISRPKVNPFGDAKPREVLLQEKGLDWRKIDLDLDHRRVDRPETDAEKILKEEIDDLKKKFAELSASDGTREIHEGATDDLHASITSKERDLELLIRELDDKVRFRPRVHERPGSGAGRVSGPPSRSESFDESRNMEFTERPRSRGTVDIWSRQSDDRRAFQGGTERGFMGNRGMDRSRSRERW